MWHWLNCHFPGICIKSEKGKGILTGPMCHFSPLEWWASELEALLDCCSRRSLSRFLKPKSSPTIPPGFGTGHALPIFAIFSASASICRNVDTSSSATWEILLDMPLIADGSSQALASFFFFARSLRIDCPSGFIGVSESAKVRRGAGQGNICGMPTMRNEAKRVAAKREVVERDRGCKWGGITVYSNGKIMLQMVRSSSLYC